MPGFSPGPATLQLCRRAFGVLADGVQRAQAAGSIRPGDPTNLAQQIWAACHGATSLELRGIGFVDDRDANYRALIDTVLAGLAPVS